MRPRDALVLLCLCVGGCASVSSNLPDRMTTQIRRDYHCNEMSGDPIGGSEGSGTWSVVACGRRLVVTCPEGPHSRWRRCTYGGAGDDPEARGRYAAPSRPTTARTAQPAPPTVVAEAPTVPPAATESPASSPEARARQQLDAHAPAILACSAGQPVAIDVTWGDGTMSLSLVPPHAGTAAEGCVAHAVGDVTLPEGSRGQLRHVIAPE